MQNADLISSLRNPGNAALGAGNPEEKADTFAHINSLQAALWLLIKGRSTSMQALNICSYVSDFFSDKKSTKEAYEIHL